jgi:hypothetical protein
MAGGSPEHHVDRMGHRLDDRSVAVVLAFENFGITKPRRCSVSSETPPAALPSDERISSVLFRQAAGASKRE